VRGEGRFLAMFRFISQSLACGITLRPEEKDLPSRPAL
jgi:hypothetical protein